MNRILTAISVCLFLLTGCSFNKAVRGGKVVDHYNVADCQLPIEEIYYRNLDGTPLYAWFVKRDNYQRLPIVIFLHGSRGNIQDYLPLIKNLYDSLDVNIFAPDFPGTGASKGEIGLDNTKRMTLAALEYLKSRNDIRQDKIVLFGTSMGATLALYGGMKQESIPIIVDSGVTSANDYVKSHYFPLGLPNFLIHMLGENFDNYRAVKTMKNPKLFLHGSRDNFIYLKYAQRLYAEAAGPKVFLQVDGGHVLFGEKEKTQELAKVVQSFLRKYLPE